MPTRANLSAGERYQHHHTELMGACLWRIAIFRHSLTFRDLDTMRVCAIWLCFFSI
jgi:hypothetical protein